MKVLRLVFVINLISCQQFTKDELQNIFGSKKCIQGSLSNIDIGEENILKVRDVKSDYQKLINVTKLEQIQNEDKSVLSKLNEFAQYNNLDYYFKLENEDGLSHEKTFTVSLNIGEEKYVAQGSSLMKAKQNAADMMFEKTNYVHLPSKDKSEKIDDTLTPTVLLNNVCTQLGIKVDYALLDKEHDILKSNVVISDKSKKSYLQRLNDSLNSNKSLHVKKDLPDTKGPFTIKLEVGDNVFYGAAQSIQAARHEAASKAIDFLLENRDSLDMACLEEDSEKCKNKRNNLKSPVSLAYEAAQARGMYLECEITNESGDPHKKSFTTQCQIGDLITVGEGRSKKASKKSAAEAILERIDELPEVSREKQVKYFVNSKKSKKNNKKKKKIIRSKFEELSFIAGNSIKAAFGLGSDEVATDDLNTSGRSKKSGNSKYQKQSFQDEILKLSGLLDFNINYLDFKEEGKHFSLLSLHFSPEYLCFGEGFTEYDARTKAANGALDLMYKLDLNNHFEQKYSSLENDIKASVHNILHASISEESK